MRRKPAEWLDCCLVAGPYLRLCLTEKDYIDQLVEHNVDVEDRFPFKTKGDAHCAEYTGAGGRHIVLVCLCCDHAKHKPIPLAGLLLHEAVHVWQAHCRRIGEHEPSIEFEAYSIQSIAQQLMWSYCDQTGVKT